MGFIFEGPTDSAPLLGSVLSLGYYPLAEGPALKKILIVLTSVWTFQATLCAAQAAQDWPEVIALLTKARTQATTCVQVLKSNGDKASIARAQLTYGMAEGEMDGVIAGLTTVLVEDGDSDRLTTVQSSIQIAGKGLREICDAAIKITTPHTKGVWEEIAKGATEPLIQAISAGISAVWTRHVEKDRLELETKKSLLEAAKWPVFSDISAR